MRAARSNAVERRERRVVGDAERAVRLHRAIDRALQHVRDEELEQRDLLARGVRALGVHLPRGVEDHQARGVDPGARLGDPLLDDLARAERLAGLDLARHGALAHQIERALADADPAHRVVDAPGPEALLREHEPRALLAESVRLRDAHAFEAELARGSIQPSPAWPITGMLRTKRRPGVFIGTMICDARPCAGGLGIRHRHDDAERGAVRAGREPFVPVDDVVAAVFARGRARATSGSSPDGRARSCRSSCGSRPRRAARATFAFAPRFRGASGAPCCRRPALGSRRRSDRAATDRAPRSRARARSA